MKIPHELFDMQISYFSGIYPDIFLSPIDHKKLGFCGVISTKLG